MIKFVWFLVLSCCCCSAMAEDPSVACIQKLGGDDRLQSLFKKAPLDISKGQPLEVLANQSKATAKEKTALSILVSELDRCTELGADWRKQNYPASINGYGNTYQSFLRSAMAELYAGKLTFGDFAKARDRELTELLNKVSQEVQKIQAQRAGDKRQEEQAANDAEEQRKAAVRRSYEQAEAQGRYEEQRRVSETLCVRHNMTTRSMNAKQDEDERYGAEGGAAANPG
jgi:hypothetical protein